MHIQTVELKDCAFSAETGRFHATLLMQSDARRMCLRSTVDFQDGMRRADVARSLIDDAIRQLKRMPEFRNSDRQITVSDAALPGASNMLLAA